jgi:hypothetical protein
MPDNLRRLMPLWLSLFAHLLLIIFMVVYVLPTLKEDPWLEFQWTDTNMPEETVTEAIPSETEGGMIEMTTQANPPQKNQPTPKPVTPINPPQSDRIATARPGTAEVVEAPVLNTSAPAINVPPSLTSSPIATSALREMRYGVPQPADPGQMSFSLEGGKLVLASQPSFQHDFQDYGEVRLSFMVDNDARLLAGTVKVLQTSKEAYNRKAVEALKAMSFTFRGAPAPDREYIVTIKFTVN